MICTAARIAQLVYILDLFRAQIGFPDQVRAIVREHKRWHSWKIGIEDNAYQWALGQTVWEKGLPAIPVPSIKDKVTRAQLTTPHFETGRVRFRGRMENGVLVPHPAIRRWEMEAIDFPFGENDDVVDAVVGAVQMCLDEEIIGQHPVFARTGGLMAIVGGRGRRGGDPYDVFRSNY